MTEAQHTLTPGWGVVPAEARRLVSLAAQGMFAALWAEGRDRDGVRVLDIGVRRIASLCDVSKTTAMAYLRELVDAGLVSREVNGRSHFTLHRRPVGQNLDHSGSNSVPGQNLDRVKIWTTSGSDSGPLVGQNLDHVLEENNKPEGEEPTPTPPAGRVGDVAADNPAEVDSGVMRMTPPLGRLGNGSAKDMFGDSACTDPTVECGSEGDHRPESVETSQSNGVHAESDDAVISANGNGHKPKAKAREKKAGQRFQPYPAAFEAFWAEFPTRVGGDRGSKAKALELWTAMSTAQRREAHDAAVQFAVAIAGERLDTADREFVPHARRWLYERRWEEPATTGLQRIRDAIDRKRARLGSHGRAGPQVSTNLQRGDDYYLASMAAVSQQPLDYGDPR